MGLTVVPVVRRKPDEVVSPQSKVPVPSVSPLRLTSTHQVREEKVDHSQVNWSSARLKVGSRATAINIVFIKSFFI
jgi:hypothetical protein